MQMIKYGILATLLYPGTAHAGARDMYRDKRYPFIDIRVAQDSQTIAQCVLGQIYGAKLHKPETEKREILKKGGKQLTLIHWGGDEQNSLEVEEVTAGHGRTRLTGWYPSSPSSTGSFDLIEPCIAKGDGTAPISIQYAVDKDKSIVGRMIGKVDLGKVHVLESEISRANIIQCMASYPRTTSNDYNAYYYSPQIITQENGSIKLGWYDSGNMITGPKPLYHYFLVNDADGKRKIEVYLRGALEGSDASGHWLVQLARSCGKNGNNDDVTSWPRSRYWTPKGVK